ncbi:MAG TPA: hypothetical protein VEA40_13930, partial [Ramlibacter sp.]|nr:hypothetical protein [Ramlibacter sp.]
MRMLPISRILAFSLVLLATVPALLAAWLLARASTDAVEALAGRLLSQVALVVQTGTEAHLRQAHDVLNGLVSERPGAAEQERSRAWLQALERYEPLAFALIRQSPDVSQVHVGNVRGEYLGVQAAAQGVRVYQRAGGQDALAAFE